MIAPSYYVDPKTGNNYLLTVQFPESQVKSLTDFQQIPVRSHDGTQTANLGAVTDIAPIETPTEVDHYQLRRVIDIYVSPSDQDLGGLANRVDRVNTRCKGATGFTCHHARIGGRNAEVLCQFRDRVGTFHHPCLLDPDGAVLVLYRSADDGLFFLRFHQASLALSSSCSSPAPR